MTTTTETMTARDELRKAFEGSVFARVAVHSATTKTDNLIIATEETIEEMTEKIVCDGLAAGQEVVRADGTREWIHARLLVDLTKQGADQFIWSKDDRVKHERVHVIIDADGNRTETVVGTTYRKFE
jgi:phosphoribosylamine-glycine ligase